jgi:hypothetical protein
MVRTTQSIHFNTERPKLFILHTTTDLSTMLLPQRRTVPKLWTKMFVVVLNIMLLMMSLEVDVVMAQAPSASPSLSLDPSSRCVSCEIMHSIATTANQSLTLYIIIIISDRPATHRVGRPVIRHPGECIDRCQYYQTYTQSVSQTAESLFPNLDRAVIRHRGEYILRCFTRRRRVE